MQVGSWLRGLLRIEIILFKSPFLSQWWAGLFPAQEVSLGSGWHSVPWAALRTVAGAQGFQALIVVLF